MQESGEDVQVQAETELLHLHLHDPVVLLFADQIRSLQSMPCIEAHVPFGASEPESLHNGSGIMRLMRLIV